MNPTASTPIVKNERMFLLTLAGIQFTHILDFMIIMPLGPQLIRLLDLSTQEFGLLLSCYTLSAAVSGLLAATYVDRFDRRRLLLTLYSLFILATLFCGLAPNYIFLLVARSLAGVFGGILSGITQTIIADVIPYERRGKAVGLVMSSFALSTVVGVPLGLFLANHFPALGWRAPFFFVVLVSSLCLFIGFKCLPSITMHLGQTRSGNVFQQLCAVAFEPNHMRAYAFVSLLMMAGFTVTPFIALYLTTNVAVPESFITVIYLCGGTATLFSSRVIGWLSDRYGKLETLRWVVFGSMVTLLITTNLVPVPLWFVLLNSTCYFILVSGRHIPGMALVTQVADPNVRGTFMSLVSSLQMLATGLASLVTGMVISRNEAGEIVNFNIMGYVAVTMGLLAIWMAHKLAVLPSQSQKDLPSEQKSDVPPPEKP